MNRLSFMFAPSSCQPENSDDRLKQTCSCNDCLSTYSRMIEVESLHAMDENHYMFYAFRYIQGNLCHHYLQCKADKTPPEKDSDHIHTCTSYSRATRREDQSFCMPLTLHTNQQLLSVTQLKRVPDPCNTFELGQPM